MVVGAGPAGSTAARTLALGGARVLILDRATFPRSKPCGGGLTWRVLVRFPYLESVLPRIATHAVTRLYMEGPGGQAVTVDGGRPTVMMIRRIEFDHLLLQLAQEAGAELVEGAEITRAEHRGGMVHLETREGHSFDAPLVVAADGVYSVVSRRLGFNSGWPSSSVALDLMEETPADQLRATDEQTLWVSFAPGAGHGYGYIFPKASWVNVGVGYLLSSFKTDIAQPPYQVHTSFIAKARQRGLLVGASDRARFLAYQIPLGGPLPVTARRGVYLAGDAGGFVNGFSAEGIFFAMVSGDLAGRAILDGPSTRRYQRYWRREIGVELRDSRFLSRYLFADLSRVDRLVRAVRIFPDVNRLLVSYAVGELTYQEARRQFLVRFPRVGMRLAASFLLGRT
ncbi:MAG: geranylgeranyl reductase family protein [Acidobacteria bacterium]|nr:geranylgeranyl reductase family protein [Acidobacteriota bacterium]